MPSVQGSTPDPPPAETPATIAQRYVVDIFDGKASDAMDLTCPHLRIPRSVREGLLSQVAVQTMLFGEVLNIAVQGVDEHNSTASVMVSVQRANMMGQSVPFPVDLVKENGSWKVDGFTCGGKAGCRYTGQTPPEYEPVEMGRHYAGTLTSSEESPPGVSQIVIAITSRSESQVTIEEATTPSYTDTWTGTYDTGTRSLMLRSDANLFELQYINDDRWKGVLRRVKGTLPNGDPDYASFQIELSTR